MQLQQRVNIESQIIGPQAGAAVLRQGQLAGAERERSDRYQTIAELESAATSIEIECVDGCAGRPGEDHIIRHADASAADLDCVTHQSAAGAAVTAIPEVQRSMALKIDAVVGRAVSGGFGGLEISGDLAVVGPCCLERQFLRPDTVERYCG